jgi:hypothetical protein
MKPLKELSGVWNPETIREEEERNQETVDQFKKRLAGTFTGAPKGYGIYPKAAEKRKAAPIYEGFIRYFPKAIWAVAELSRVANEQHNPDTPVHWDRSKSGDELDALMRHLTQAGGFDTDGQRHSAKVAWRAMANLEKELEAADPIGTSAGHGRLDGEG